MDIVQATLNITDIGVFMWDPSTVNASDLHSASIRELPLFDSTGNSYAHVNGCRIETGGSAVFRVFFKIPEDAQRGDYRYDFYMPIVTDIPVQLSGIINVYPLGETPQSGAFSSVFLIGLFLVFVFSPTYLVLRWRKARAVKYAKIGVIIALILVLIALGSIIVDVVSLSFRIFPFWPLPVLLIIGALVWRRRKKKNKAKENSA